MNKISWRAETCATLCVAGLRRARVAHLSHYQVCCALSRPLQLYCDVCLNTCRRLYDVLHCARSQRNQSHLPQMFKQLGMDCRRLLGLPMAKNCLKRQRITKTASCNFFFVSFPNLFDFLLFETSVQLFLGPLWVESEASEARRLNILNTEYITKLHFTKVCVHRYGHQVLDFRIQPPLQQSYSFRGSGYLAGHITGSRVATCYMLHAASGRRLAGKFLGLLSLASPTAKQDIHVVRAAEHGS